MNQEEIRAELVADIKTALREVQQDVNTRNVYMNERDRVIYEDGLFENIDFPDGSDKTLFNYLQRAVQIHTSQFMGRGFQIYSTYNKQDLSIYPDGSPELKAAELQNKKLKAFAETRQRVMAAIIEDNGGMAKFEQGAELGSAYGETIYKSYLDKKNGQVVISLLETPQNYFPLWSDSNFRERDGDAYVYQMSLAKAQKNYGSKFAQGELMSITTEGDPFTNNNTADPINQTNAASPTPATQSGRKMVTLIEFTGIVVGWCYSGKDSFYRCKPGEEKPFNVLIVGDKIVEVITADDYMPRYWRIPNKVVPRRTHGASDISSSAIHVNKTLIEVMSTWITLFHKEISPLYKAKGFVSQTIPTRKRKTATFIPMTLEQDISELGHQQDIGPASRQVIEELKDSLVRVLGIGRVLFDDPTINPTSNQALMTTLKGVVDIVESKQKNHEPVLNEMFKDALKLSVKIAPELKEAVEDEGWRTYIKWPSVLRREDASYQQMWQNRFNAGNTSVDTFLEAMGVEDTSEEVDRIRDDMRDPVRAAILGRQLPQLAQQTIAPPAGPPPPQVKYNVNVKADASVDPQENMEVVSKVMGEPMPAETPGQEAQTDGLDQGNNQPDLQLTPDQNQGQSASMPGSGAPAVSPQGAINQVNQQQGA